MGPSIQNGLTVVADNRQMRVYFSMTEKTVMQYLSEHQSMEAAIRQMPELRLQLPNGTLYEHTGRVESISGVVAERTGAVSVCARFDNPDGMLLSGGTGKIVYIQTFTFHRYQRVHRAVGGDFAAVAAGGALSRHRAARLLRVGELSGRECRNGA